ncbi:cysteine desulfurase [Bizionia argentinensis JUB59]|uniref:cysteine desulfurase n=1 Tax=Bizionia argentinensis JUB59 TaxID=1046627 RepID=G2ECB5_9FLAO|nr:cysteine desulfurase family protein [Bizionia argentinensis]EGV43923.1 cysteine desulfurase [Bizionia argentinensis JUB59]
MKPVYFDSAATTKVRDEVIDAMTTVMRNDYGNASSTHSFGRSSKVLIEKARKTIAKRLNVSAGEIVFTSGGTEADNLALQCAVRDLGVTHIITSKVEHHAVLHTVQQLEKTYDVKVSYVKLDTDGLVNYADLEHLLQTDGKTLVSLMHVNNEIGNILDIKRVGNLCKTHNALFHSDAVQSVGHYEIDLQDIHVDYLAASAHKFHGPKGVGFAFIRKNSGLKPLIFGGEQERGIRAGTEATHDIVGLEKAYTMAYDNLEKESDQVLDLKKYFISELKNAFPDVTFNGLSGNLEKSTYTLINVCLPLPPEKALILLFQMDLKGIACSKGSACQSGSSKGSHVLTEVLCEDDLKKPSIRFSFSIYNTKNEIDYVISVLKEFVE